VGIRAREELVGLDGALDHQGFNGGITGCAHITTIIFNVVEFDHKLMVERIIAEEGERRTPASIHIILATIRIPQTRADKEGKIGRGHGCVDKILIALESGKHHMTESTRPREFCAMNVHTVGADLVGVVGKDAEDFFSQFFEKIRGTKEVVVDTDGFVTGNPTGHHNGTDGTATGSGVSLDVKLAFLFEFLEDLVDANHKKAIKSTDADDDINLGGMDVAGTNKFINGKRTYNIVLHSFKRG